jgi:NCAIR mutase (PurE)-related protein
VGGRFDEGHAELGRRPACVGQFAPGALASVVSGLVAAPVVGGADQRRIRRERRRPGRGGAMLASCAPGLAVVNIDNGFGAAVHAAKILRAAVAVEGKSVEGKA